MFIFSFEIWLCFSFFNLLSSVFCPLTSVICLAAPRPSVYLLANWWGTHSPSTIGAICAFDAKKGLFRRWKIHVSRFQEGSKKNFEKMDFCSQLYAHLIEIWGCVMPENP
jgi:hypothetical protein